MRPPGAASPWDVWTIDVADVTQSEAVDFTVSGFMSLLSESYIEPTVLKTGSGTMLLTGKCKSQSAGKYLPFTIREGVLKLGVADAMCASQNIELNGGTLELLEGYDEETGLCMRHHFISNVDEFTVYVNGEEITPDNVEGTNIYYFDVFYGIATYADEVNIVIEVEGETVEYDVSVYSYIAIALEKGDDSVKTFVKALYDLNEACLDYIAGKE